MRHIILIRKIFDLMTRYRQSKPEVKAGFGLLFGTRRVEESGNITLTITDATVPRKKDLRRKYIWKIKSRHHWRIKEKLFEKSNGTVCVIGNWRTKPEDHPSPSDVDLRDWERQFSVNEHLFDDMLFLLVGRKSSVMYRIGKERREPHEVMRIIG